ncbi:MAG TPA: TetR/AcrR family transcriptional regulator [Xanthobacteraceae bacterium]|nr:TetR/AcrR family transcriptional regulator [Xanthobacteraceae bacterium]
MKTAAKVHPKTRKTVSGQKHATIQSYHHGDLHDALLKAAETVLERDGVQGLTLRAAAREAGVSHAAPTHHFGDMTGLISELAAVGFRRFAAALTNAANAAASQSAHARLDAMGIAYVTFARTYPGLFMLMFRSERLDMERPALKGAARASSEALARAVAEHRGETLAPQRPTAAQAAEMLRAWSMVHGFAVLLLDHRLDNFLAMWPGATPDKLLSAMLRQPPPADH